MKTRCFHCGGRVFEEKTADGVEIKCFACSRVQNKLAPLDIPAREHALPDLRGPRQGGKKL